MQQPQQPAPPPVHVNAEALALIWGPRATALADANASAKRAEDHEANAATWWAEAAAKRERVAQLRAEADAEEIRAAEKEAEATAADHQGRLHRSDQANHNANAKMIAANVEFLARTNNLLHPQERQQRSDQAAAANAAANGVPSGTPIGDMVSAGLGPTTAPFTPVPSEVAK